VSGVIESGSATFAELGRRRRALTLEEAVGLARKRTVLLAEDDAELRHMLVESLIHDGFDVVAVRDGETALSVLAAATRSGQEMPFDALLSDVWMPRKNGLEVLARVRREGWRLPVVLLTAALDARGEADALGQGAAAVLRKPVPLRDVSGMLWRVIQGASATPRRPPRAARRRPEDDELARAPRHRVAGLH
jgi:DNA-binding response OmpR family regulator